MKTGSASVLRMTSRVSNARWMGRFLSCPPAGTRTGRRNAAIIGALDTWAQGDGRGYVFDSSTGFTLPDGSMRSPDVAWVEAGRWDALSKAEQNRFSPLCPDFLIELRSPTDDLSALEVKMERWIANGAKVAWLIDPEGQAVIVYARIVSVKCSRTLPRHGGRA
jgi:Uma2 family endonuclease